ncbi:MAG: Holliday junction branch migration protein RuvA [Flavobacteriales bacterium]|nr:Holliday junction branch migration protein RuvA [Flavobacteriales bacterium]|tara:strand:- start:18768 stop:19349 length:582 start_codon:yes stop_codon:yes gene_type:complete
MITHIKGKLIEKNPSFVIIDCNGVGYLLRISLQTFSKLADDEQCMLFSHLAIKEDSHTLYGFFDKNERDLFRQLISVSGVGPNTAQMILSSLTPQEIQQSILTENVIVLKGVKGIGGKTAQRIILDLKDKIAKIEITTNSSINSYNTIREEALSALAMLGFSKSSMEKFVDNVLQNDSNVEIEELVKRVLKKM